jgi:hypothetical protein
MSYYYDLGGQARSVWALYLEDSAPKVALSLGIIDKWSHDAAVNMVVGLRKNPLLEGRLTAIETTDLNKFPTFPIDSILVDPTAQQAFFDVLDGLLMSNHATTNITG